ncbi:FTR1 family protein [Pelomicrobium methylotrophicum]|uniref:C-type cytochrome n=1 Tax=Pelomicrobium methylotrophicum TaxID=2602750 RepID=A0A5C7EJ92_9PROT|nr:FTR1 family protein [Pelomicrobium methylotrophicum]TXF11395.1 c-type cytochrome [Pelomicrobium methylotrophicum]
MSKGSGSALGFWLAAVFAAALIAAMEAHAALSEANLRDAQNIVHMLDYVSVDYPEFVRDGQVLNDAEYREQLEFAGQVLALLETLPPPQQADLLAQAAELKRRIEGKAPGEEVSRLASALRWAVIDAYDLAVTPKRAPDLSRARTLYAEHCAGCHGAQGRGDGPAASGMDPPPSDFHDQARMASRSVYGLYSTITLGVAGTPMASFRHLSEEDRWALAFYVSGMGVDPALAEKGAALWKDGAGRDVFTGLKPLATLTRKEAAEKHGPDAAMVMAWLTAHPEAVGTASGSPIDESRRLLAESVDAYRRGDRAEAQRLAVAAYLEGFELAEAGLDTVARSLRIEVEAAMMAYRGLLRSGAPVAEVESKAAAIDVLLARAQELFGGEVLSPSAAAVSAFVILLREGLEAILVLAAVIAFLVKAERRDLLKYVHAGWTGALLLGVATWAMASHVVSVSGAGRELTEGVTALLAAAILIYVGFWLHGKSHAQAWKAFIEQRLKGALSRGTVSALVAVSFLAVYREVFETVLFYQALWTQTGDTGGGSILVGFLGGAAALVVISWGIFRYGVRLPIGPFFTVSSVLVALLAVVFVGQGVAALQEAGRLPADLVAFPRVPVLGIYPTVQSLAAQTAALLLVIAGFVWMQRAARKHPRKTPAGA